MPPLTLTPIGVVHSPFREKFGIPRQPSLVPSATGAIELLPPFDDPAAVAGLEGFSHLWVIFVFHHNRDRDWRARVRPPRLGGNRTLGVFATRSPYRPNPLGLSVLPLLGVDLNRGVRLQVGGLDLLDGTPVVDIKPYVPYTDRLDARGGFAATPPAGALAVRWSAAAGQALAELPVAEAGHLRRLVQEVLTLDPRPAYRQEGPDAHTYGMRLGDWNIRWRVADAEVEVVEVAAAAG